MTNEELTSRDHRKAEAQQGFGLALLWLWPVLLLHALIETFKGEVQRLKTLRRAKLRLRAEDWRLQVENLRVGEWLMRAYLAREAEKLLLGKRLDLSNTLVPVPPKDWTRPCPKSVRELLLRTEAMARIFADPLRHVERYARRLIKTAYLADPRGAEALFILAPKRAYAAELSPLAPILAPSWTLGIPAPP